MQVSSERPGHYRRVLWEREQNIAQFYGLRNADERMNGRTELFVAQGDYRIDTHGAASGCSDASWRSNG